VKVLSASADGARLHIRLENMQTVNQLAIEFSLGPSAEGEVLFTVNEVPAPTAGQ
jgi:hypothetical protein